MSERRDAFEHAARSRPPPVLLQLWSLLRERRAWWMIPVITVVVLLGLIAGANAGAAGTFIYTLF